MRAAQLAGFAVAATLVLAACGGDDDDRSAVTGPTDSAAVGDEQAYADAFSASLQQEGDDVVITTEQADCIGPRFVDVIGVERLQDAGVSPADVASGDDLDFSELGLDEDEGNDLYDAFGVCDVDLRDTLVDAMAADDSMTEDVRTCLEDGFTDDVVRQFVVTAMVQGDDAAPPASGGPASFDEVFATCVGSVTGSLPTTTDD